MGSLNTALVVAWVAAFLLACFDGIGWLVRRWVAHPRSYAGWRSSVAVASLACGWAGALTTAGWSMVRFPGVHSLDEAQQPAPALLWQLGLALVIVGCVGLLIAVLGAPPMDPSRPPQWRDEHAGRVVVAMLVLTDVPLLTATAVSTHSQLRAAPLVLAATVTVFSLWQARAMRD